VKLPGQGSVFYTNKRYRLRVPDRVEQENGQGSAFFETLSVKGADKVDKVCQVISLPPTNKKEKKSTLYFGLSQDF